MPVLPDPQHMASLVYFNYAYSGERVGRALMGFEFPAAAAHGTAILRATIGTVLKGEIRYQVPDVLWHNELRALFPIEEDVAGFVKLVLSDPRVVPEARLIPTISYEEMIKAAFWPQWWNGGPDQLKENFSLFFGLAMQLYQGTLVADDTPPVGGESPAGEPTVSS